MSYIFEDYSSNLAKMIHVAGLLVAVLTMLCVVHVSEGVSTCRDITCEDWDKYCDDSSGRPSCLLCRHDPCKAGHLPDWEDRCQTYCPEYYRHMRSPPTAEVASSTDGNVGGWNNLYVLILLGIIVIITATVVLLVFFCRRPGHCGQKCTNINPEYNSGIAVEMTSLENGVVESQQERLMQPSVEGAVGGIWPCMTEAGHHVVEQEPETGDSEDQSSATLGQHMTGLYHLQNKCQ